MCLAIGYVAARLTGSGIRRMAVAGFSAAAIALFAFFYPVLSAVPVSFDSWRARIWFMDCDLDGLSLSEISLPAGVPTPADVPGPYPEATLRGGGSPPGWCWI
jgi:hypothetical protein